MLFLCSVRLQYCNTTECVQAQVLDNSVFRSMYLAPQKHHLITSATVIHAVFFSVYAHTFIAPSQSLIVTTNSSLAPCYRSVVHFFENSCNKRGGLA